MCASRACLEFASLSVFSALLCSVSSSGANKGIGYHIVDQLARGDPNLLVLLCSRDASRGAAAVSQLGLPNVTAVTLDVTSTSSIEHVAGEVQAKYGGIDLLCNNAGVIERGGDTTGSAEAVDHTLAVNYRAVLAMCERFAPIINKNGRSARPEALDRREKWSREQRISRSVSTLPPACFPPAS